RHKDGQEVSAFYNVHLCAFVSLCLILFLSSCHLIKRYGGPEAPIPNDWKNEHQEEQLYAECMYNLDNWWEVFNDPVLNYLEEYAIDANNNLWAALEKIFQARAIALENKSYLYPQVNFSPSMSRYGMLFYNPLSSAIAGGSGASTAAASSTSSGG